MVPGPRPVSAGSTSIGTLMEDIHVEPPAPELRSLGKGATVWVAGEGDPLLVLHGWGLRPDVYMSGLLDLAGRGFQVAAPTLAVVGRRWDMDRAVHRVCKTLDHLGWDRAIVVGNSLGGAVGISFASRHPGRVRLLGLVNSVGLPLDRGVLGWAMPFRRYATAANLGALTAFGRNALHGRGLLNLAGAAFYARGAGLAEELERVRLAGVPAAILWGEDDRLLPLDMGREVARMLGAPVRIVPGADHDWTVRHPRLFARELELTLRAVLRDRSRNNGSAVGGFTKRLRAADRRAGGGTPTQIP